MIKTQIIATIGPASSNFSILQRLFKAGMDCVRINTKYGNIKQYENTLKCIEKLNSEKKRKCKILFDIKSIKYLPWLQKQKFDYLAVAFAESAKQILEIKKILRKKDVKIISKIETKKGIDNLYELIKVSDGIMVARGDLGDNVPLERLPIFQKEIIRECNKKKRFVITATEMLLSMQNSKEPERAEVTDIANAVLDGSNALMLSEETAIGKYPAEAVKMMNKIIKETEGWK